MQRRAAAVYVLLFLVIAVGALVFINVVDGPSESLDEVDYELSVDDTVTIDGTTYEVTNLGEFSATLTFTVDEDDRATTLRADTLINVSEPNEYRLEIPDVEEPENATLVETFPDHDLDTVEHDGVTYVVLEPGEFMEEQAYLEEEFGPRDEIFLTVGDSFQYYVEDVDTVAEVTVDAITAEGIDISWTGPSVNRIVLPRNAVSSIGDTDFGVNFVGDRIQLTSDVDAFDEHLEAHDTWDERYQGFWGVGVLGILAALLIGGLSFLPRRG